MLEKEEKEMPKAQRAKRVKRLKKIILGFVFLLLTFPIVLCMFLFVKLNRLEKTIQELMLQQEVWAEKEVTEEETLTPSEVLTENIEKEETAEVAGKKKVYLTFDDGPSTYTGEILDILKEYNVKATFFVVGREDEKYRDLYKRIVDEGHSLGIHSYSHRYWEIYESVDTFAEDITKLQDMLFEITGVRPQIMRFPGGSSNRVSKANMKDIISYVNEKEIVYYDWNISSGDAATNKLTADRIVENCMNGITEFDSSIILMHDASDKYTTVEALPVLIEKILESDDTVLLPITEETQPIQHIK